MDNVETVTDLVDEKLNAVSFVMDYVEFHFNGPVLRALTNVQLKHEHGMHTFPEPGSRDALCSLIGKALTALSLQEESGATLVFSNGAVITIPLGKSARSGPEAMHFVPGLDKPIAVW